MKRCMGCMAVMKEEDKVCQSCGYVEGTPPREAYHMEPGSILSGRYIAGRVLGFGGFGVTYAGWDEQLQRKVAIKEFLPSSMATRMPGYTELSIYGGDARQQFEAGLERFVEEARRLAKFNGIAGIVDIYDTFVENNTAYIVMEYLKGQDVKRRLEQGGTFSYEEARKIILAICETLRPVHLEGIIHRDISPDNIYLTESGEVKLLDFGASRHVTGVNSKSLSVILKAGYAPEEQYRSRGNQGSWSDVYALAATFYKMITGVTPPDSMERAILDELEEPSKLGTDIPAEGENAILNAMNVRRENRTQTVEAFALQLCTDKVERVKEKTAKEDTGNLSLWGKLLLGGSIGITLLFGLLTAIGVVNLGQGTMLSDQFGSGVTEGYINAPGILNLMESEAQNRVKTVGLDYLIVGKEYSDKVTKGKILSQSPLPGRVIALGEKLEVTISGGSRQEAIAAGEMAMPDVTFMDVGEAMYAMKKADFTYSVQYEFSDTVAESLIIRYEPNESGSGAELIVSAGRKGQIGEYGQVRAPFYNDRQRRLQFMVSVEKKPEHSVKHGLQYQDNQDGSWHDLVSSDGMPWLDNESYNVNENRPEMLCSIYISQLIALTNQQLLGQELRLKLVRYVLNDSSGEYVRLDETEIPGTLTVTGEESGITIKSLELIDWETVARLKTEKELAPGNPLLEKMEIHEAWTKEYVPARLTGEFRKGRYYQILTQSRNLGRYVVAERCDQEGILYFSLDRSWKESEVEQTCIWYITERGKGNRIGEKTVVVEMGASGTVTLANGEVTKNGRSKPLLETASRYLNREEEVKISYISSLEAPGTVVGEFIGAEPSFTVSVGEVPDDTEEGRFLLGYMLPRGRENLLYGVLNSEDELGRYDGACDVIYSEDGGSVFQILTGKEGRRPFSHSESVIKNKNLSTRMTRFFYLTEILLEDRPDLWGKELVLGIQGPTKTLIEETFLILEDREKVVMNHMTILDRQTLSQYHEDGRIPYNERMDHEYDQYMLGVDTEAFYQATGNFQVGNTYYIMPGGGTYTTNPYRCVREGELIFVAGNLGQMSDQYRMSHQSTTVQSLDYEYRSDKKQLVAHISKPVKIDILQKLKE